MKEKSYNKEKYSFDDFVEIVERLTGENGCPWDKEQTHKSIRINMIEEAYEAVDAIDRGDKNAIIEELGDVLLQPVLHADIAKRRGDFSVNDVISAICKKLYQRHTHIFGKDTAKNAADALNFWQAAKEKENKQKEKSSPPQTFSSAIKAQKLFKRQAKEKAINKEETKKRLLECLENTKNNVGEFLFLAVGLSALEGFDAEVELNEYCKRVESRE